MVRWKKDTKEIDTSITLGEAMSKPINYAAENIAQYCSFCKNPKSMIPKTILGRLWQSDAVKFMRNTIKDMNVKKFTIKDVIEYLHAEHITGGDKIRHLLLLLVLHGELKVTIEEIEINKKTKPKYWYEVNETRTIPECVKVINVKDKRGLAHVSNQWIEKQQFGLHKGDNE